jgi:hypothetical protein
MLTVGRGALLFGLFSAACARSSPAREAAQPGAEGPQTVSATEGDAPPAPPPAPGTPSSTADESTKDPSLLDAVREFDRHRLELSQLIGRDLGGQDLEEARPAEPESPSAGAAPSPREAPRTSRAPAADKAASRAEGDSKAKPLKKGDDGCVNVCRALDSLTRSAAAVCRLDGGAERCRRANSVVSVAQDEPGVKACACKR